MDSNVPFTWRQLILLCGALAVFALLWMLAPILMPFLLGAGFAYILNPIVVNLTRIGLPRWLAVGIVFLVLALFWALMAVLVGPVLFKQAGELASSVPAYLQQLDTTLRPYLSEWFGFNDGLDTEIIKNFINDNKATLSQYAGNMVRSGLGVVGAVLNLLILPVVMFYLLLDWPRFMSSIQNTLPRDIEPTVTKLARESDEALAAFLRGQLLVMLCLAIMYSLGLWLVGIKFALLIGVIAGVVSFVPYLGNIVGIGLATIMVLMQQDSLLPLLYVAGVFGVGQLIEGTILTPKLVGDRIQLHPLAVIFAVLAGGQLFGFTGVLIALPAAAVLAIVVRHFYTRYQNSDLYNA